MLNKILFPTDFSSSANNALLFAIDLCKRTNASLHVLYVQSMPIMDASYPMDSYLPILKQIEESANANLEGLKNQKLIPSGIDFVIHQSVGNHVALEITNFAESSKMDLIVMGTKGASGIESVLIGSNAASVVSKAIIPVLVIPPSAHTTQLKNLLYASDYNEPEFPALNQLQYFAALYKANINVLHVSTESDNYFDMGNSLFTSKKNEGKLADITIINRKDMEITDAITEQIKERQIDLLVLAKHNRSFFDRLFHRSISRQMAFHTTIPLLVLHKKA